MQCLKVELAGVRHLGTATLDLLHKTLVDQELLVELQATTLPLAATLHLGVININEMLIKNGLAAVV